MALRLVPGEPEKRPPSTSTARVVKLRALRIARGKCRDCGRRRTSYKHRCNRCQKKEHARTLRKYGLPFDKFKRVKRPRNAQRFIRGLERGLRVIPWIESRRRRRGL